MTIPAGETEVPKNTPPDAAAVAPTNDADVPSDEPIATAVDVEDPSPQAQTPVMVDVTAPANLPENYTLDVVVEGRSLTVTVPPGGVKEGEKITVPFPEGWNANVNKNASCRDGGRAPVGAWKDGLFDCFKHGVCHPVFWLAIYAPVVATGQVLHRLKLTWLGDEGTPAQTTNAFRTLLWITIVFLLVRNILTYTAPYVETEEAKMALYIAHDILRLVFGAFVVIVVARARRAVRARYDIPEENCGGCEDGCCALWCTCCTVGQMARHTADYDDYPALCCSETGMPPHVPAYAYAARQQDLDGKGRYDAPSVV